MKPMLCRKATIEEARELAKRGWFIEHKYDGVRAMLKDGRLFCRRGNDITKRFPEFAGIGEVIGTFDGEIIAQSGEFNDISGRMHMRDNFLINLSAKKSPAIFMAFDMPSETKPMDVRQLEMQGKVLPAWFKVAPHYNGEQFDDLWEQVIEQQREGLVLKKPNSKYEFGKRSENWLKVKAWEEVDAEFVTWEEHPKGITIATADGRRVVVNGEQANEVRRQLQSKGKITAEIQHLPQKDSDAWRFPSFRGLKK